MGIEDIAAELYGLDPSDFIAARDAKAAEARADDKELARRVKALRRPTQAAWAVNVLARRAPDDLRRLVDLGAALREAQATLSADQIRELGRQRHQVIAALARQAARFAGEAGHRLSDSAGREVESTLEAALADPAAAESVLAGTLSGSLEHAGLGEVNVEAAAPGPDPKAVAAAREEAERLAATAGQAGLEADRLAAAASVAAQKADEARRNHAEAVEAAEQAAAALERLVKGGSG